MTDSVPECRASNRQSLALPNHHHRQGLDCTSLVGHSFRRCSLFSYIFMRRLSFPAPFPHPLHLTVPGQTKHWKVGSELYLSLPELKHHYPPNIFSIHENINDIAFKNMKKGNKYSEIKCKWTSLNCFLAFMRKWCLLMQNSLTWCYGVVDGARAFIYLTILVGHCRSDWKKSGKEREWVGGIRKGPLSGIQTQDTHSATALYFGAARKAIGANC